MLISIKRSAKEVKLVQRRHHTLMLFRCQEKLSLPPGFKNITLALTKLFL